MRIEDLGFSHLASFVGLAADREVLTVLEREGFEGLKVAHGFVVQRLLEGPQSLTAMARDLGITQQAVSKTVGEMAELGLVVDVDSDDARQRRVALSPVGLANVEAARRARRRLEERVGRRLGSKRVAALQASLGEVLELLGGAAAVRQRKVRPVR